jgi:hypothetical protein
MDPLLFMEIYTVTINSVLFEKIYCVEYLSIFIDDESILID